jgi:hypothetical protein
VATRGKAWQEVQHLRALLAAERELLDLSMEQLDEIGKMVDKQQGESVKEAVERVLTAERERVRKQDALLREIAEDATGDDAPINRGLNSVQAVEAELHFDAR